MGIASTRPKPRARSRGEAGEPVRLVGAEDLDLVCVFAAKPPEVFPAPESGPAIHLNQVLEEAGADRDLRVDRIDLQLIHVAIAGVQKPSRLVANGDAAVAVSVTGQGDQEEIPVEFIERLGPLDSHPARARFVVQDPVGFMLPLCWQVPPPFHPALWISGGAEFGAVDVHAGLRKVGEPSGVIEVEVGQNDVADLLRFTSEGLDLSCQPFPLEKTGTGEEHEAATEPADRVDEVLFSEGGVDQNETSWMFDEKAVTDQMVVGAGPKHAR